MSSSRWLITFFSSLLIVLFAMTAFHFASYHLADWRMGAGKEAEAFRRTPDLIQRKKNWAENFDVDEIFIGSSRVAYLKTPEIIKGNRAYNFGLPAAHIHQTLDFGSYAIKNMEIERVYVGLDYLGFISPLAYKESQYSVAQKLDKFAVEFLGRGSLNRSFQRVFTEVKRSRYDTLTGNLVFRKQIASEARDQSYFESIEATLEERKPLLETDIMEQGLKHLDDFLAEAEAHNVDVVLFTTPVKNSLFDQLSHHGFDESVAEWKDSLKKRGGFIDLFYRLSEEQQAMFWDPMHLLQSHSDFVFQNIFSEKVDL